MKPPRILIIAGSDSGGGAGIQADIKTVTMLGGHAMTTITAVTAQNTLGVTAVHPVPTETVMAQIDAVIADIGVDAVKIGMIGSPFTALHIAARLAELHDVPVVFDPVMVATSGANLADDATIGAFGKLMDVATLTTPNLPELRRLTGEEDEVGGALKLVSRHGCAVLIKGGHDDGDALADALVEDDNITSWQGQRIDTTSTHGTGCTLASAIAFYLGAGLSLADSVERARVFVRLAMLEAPGLGQGHGPLGQQNVRLDTGLGLRLNQVTVTGKDYRKMVDFYRRLGLKQIVDSPDNQYARFEAGAATFSVQCDPEAEIGETVAVYFECDDLIERVEHLARSGIPFEHGPRNQPWMWLEARLRDPSGNTIFLYKAGEARRYPPWRIDDAEIDEPSAPVPPSIDELRAGPTSQQETARGMIAGIDEAGRGPLAGPVVAAAVILTGKDIRGLADSKMLKASARAALAERIHERCAVGIGLASVEEIDAINIFQATMLAMTRAAEALCKIIGCDPVEVLIDGNMTPKGWRNEWRWPARAIVGGDAKERCISAASIIAKEHRDALMLEAHDEHPLYGFDRHKGYGTPAHLAALQAHGPCPIHRRSFAPVAQLALF